MKNKRCSASQVLKFPSPQKLKKRILNGRECKSTLNEKKANMQHFWYEVVEECIAIEELKTHDNSKTGDWWKKFSNTPKHREKNYGRRVGVLKKMALKLFKTENFREVLCFLMLFEGVDAKENLQELIKIQNEEKVSVKFSAQSLVKLKCISKVKWTNLFTLSRALQTLSNGKIKCATQAEVVEYKSKLRCPRIFEHTNPVTGKSSARYVTFEDSLAFTYSTPSIVKYMNFDFEGQSEPLAVDAIYGDGTKQTKHVELTNFLCRNVNLGRLTRNPAAVQIIYLDTAKESAQAFDSAHIACFEEGIRKAAEEGVWVICLDRLQEEGQESEEMVPEANNSVQDAVENGGSGSDVEDETFEPGSCKLCKSGSRPVLRACKRSNRKRYFHQTKHALFHVKDRKAQNLTQPVKANICCTCLDDMRSGSWMEKLNKKGNDSSSISSAKVKKRKAPRFERSSKCLTKKTKTTHPISHPAYFNELHDKFISADSSFRKYIQQYAKTENHGLGIEYHEVDFESFKKSPYWCKFVAEAGDEFSGYFCDRITQVDHHVIDTLHLVITALNVASHMLVLGAQ